ncbi:PARP1.2 family protein [Megaselia abdita]
MEDQFFDYPYRTEYARSGRSFCKAKNCRQAIKKDELRIGIMVQSSYFDGKKVEWHHENCFFKKKPNTTVGDIKHIGNLRYEDQERLTLRMDKTKMDKKRKHEATSTTTPNYSLEYSKFGMCSFCQTKIERGKIRVKEEVIDLVDGASGLFYHLLCFSYEKRLLCPNGGESFPGFSSLKQVDQNFVKQIIPKVKSSDVIDAKVPKLDNSSTSFEDRMKEQNIRFYKFKCGVKDNLKKKQQMELLEANGQTPISFNLDNLANQVADLLTFGALDKCKNCPNGQFYFMNSGFLCTGSFSEWTKCKNLVKNPSRTMCIIPESFSGYEFLSEVRKPEDRLFRFVAPSQSTLNDHAKYEKKQLGKHESVEKSSISVKLTVKGGSAVDPESGLQYIAKVYVCGNDKYSVVLGVTDIQQKRNSYYKIQLLVSEAGNRFWVFRSWGRIGTTIGGDKTESFFTIEKAKANFELVYLEKTGNSWELRHTFVKVPGLLHPIDIDYDKNVSINWDDSKVTSNLPKATQELIKLIFNIDNIKKAMLEFDLDMEKMPLGKLSQDQIKKAFLVLQELTNLIKNKSTQSRYIDASNRFFTLIPHNFGMSQPPILKDLCQVQELIEMLDALMQIECAYKLMENGFQKGNENPLDLHYKMLNSKIVPIEHGSKDFRMVQTYVRNTHGETHTLYKLEVQEVFKVTKDSHKEKYKNYLHNKRLIWHGSRVTNFAGILSQGLRIAPPEAPSTGYMFGKGVYFADMVSKSAQYCSTSRRDNVGLLLLSEVALGNMLELTKSEFIEPLPDDKHSVFGKGKTSPDIFGWHIRDSDGVIIPYGRPVKNDSLQSDLLYNEYIVYDESQIDTQYLVKMKFNYSY